MSIKEKIYELKNLNKVYHTTLNPYEPGSVRIHLVPAKFSIFRSMPSLVFLNGKDIIPLNESWTILFSIFIEEVNKYSGKEVTEKEIELITKETIEKTRKVYRKAGRIDLKEDLLTMINVFTKIAIGEKVEEDIGQMSIGKYSKFMKSPHRMDLMISAMKKDGKWNCNQKCVHCYAAGQKYSEVEELNTEEWKKIIDKCKEAMIPQLTFTGGEPTIRKDLVELVDYAKWFVTRLNTNGVLLTKELCQKLYAASLDSVQITLYSNEEKIHNELVR